MEIKTELRGVDFTKGMAAIGAGLMAAALLGGVGGYAIKSSSLTQTPAPAATHVVLGQGAAPVAGSAWNFSTRQAGTQTVEGPVIADEASAQAGARSSGTQIVP